MSLRNVREGDIAVVTLDEPRKRNSLTLADWREVIGVFGQLDADPAVRGVILTGAGGGFSAGADISEFEETRAGIEKGLIYEAAYDGACDAVAAIGKPTIAAIEGYCYGGACHLAMACDFRVAAPDAKFGIPPAKLGIVYSAAGVARLQALVGVSEARRILYGAETFDADRALAKGFLDEIAPDPMAAARAWLDRLAASAPLSVRGMKLILNGLSAPHLAFDTDAVDTAILKAMASDDYAEARAAFAEKRSPNFKGS